MYVINMMGGLDNVTVFLEIFFFLVFLKISEAKIESIIPLFKAWKYTFSVEKIYLFEGTVKERGKERKRGLLFAGSLLRWPK